MWKWIFVVAVCRFEVARIIGCFMHASQLIFYFYVNSFCASNKSCGRRDWDKPLHGGCRRADVVHLKTAANRGREGERGEGEGETYKVIGLAFIFFYCKLNWSRSLWIFPFPSLLPSLFSVCWINQPLPTLSVSFTLSFLYQGQVFLSLQPSLPLLLQPTLSFCWQDEYSTFRQTADTVAAVASSGVALQRAWSMLREESAAHTHPHLFAAIVQRKVDNMSCRWNKNYFILFAPKSKVTDFVAAEVFLSNVDKTVLTPSSGLLQFSKVMLSLCMELSAAAVWCVSHCLHQQSNSEPSTHQVQVWVWIWSEVSGFSFKGQNCRFLLVGFFANLFTTQYLLS